MTAPVRVQQRRTRGWRKPENTVSVARPSKWGNPFTITAQECEEVEVGGICHVVGLQGRPFYVIAHEATPAEARAVAVEFFANGILTGRWGYTADEVRRDLAGKNLMCFCPLDQPCHADVLLELANAAAPEVTS